MLRHLAVVAGTSVAAIAAYGFAADTSYVKGELNKDASSVLGNGIPWAAGVAAGAVVGGVMSAILHSK